MCVGLVAKLCLTLREPMDCIKHTPLSIGEENLKEVKRRKLLSQVYEYMLHQLIMANMKKDKACANEVLTYLIELREAWEVATKSVISGQDIAK